METPDAISNVLREISNLRDEHNEILAETDTASARVVTVQSLYEQLSGLTVRQKGFIRTAISCAELRLYRPAIVMAWCAVFDRIMDLIDFVGYSQISDVRKNWRFNPLRESLAESYSEFQIIDACRDARIISKTLGKTLHSQLHTRNRSAHAGPYQPTLNIALAYLEDCISSIVEISEVMEENIDT